MIEGRESHMCFLQPVTAIVVAAGGGEIDTVELFSQTLKTWSSGTVNTNLATWQNCIIKM